MSFQSESQGFSHGWSVSHSSGRGWAMAEGVSCGVHTCTAKCARQHLAIEVYKFKLNLEELAKTVPARDFVWYRRAIIDAFDRVLDVGASGIDGEEG